MNSARVRLGCQVNQWSKLWAPTATIRSRGIPCHLTASSTCVWFQTIVGFVLRWNPLLEMVKRNIDEGHVAVDPSSIVEACNVLTHKKASP